MITDGNDEIKQCPNCGECIYLFDAEDVKRYPTNEAAKLKEIAMRAMKKSDQRLGTSVGTFAKTVQAHKSAKSN